MILENLKIFLQNVRKNNFIIKTILETHSNFDIIFIQEPFWSFIRSIPCHNNNEDSPLIRIVNYSNWLTFARDPVITNDHPRVAIFINTRPSLLRFSLCKDIINHRDILLSSFFNNSVIY